MGAKMMGIYAIINIITGEIYIGSSNDIHRRWKEHLAEMRSGRHKNKKLVRSWRKHGPKVHAFMIVETTDNVAALAEREGFWITAFRSAEIGFNLAALVEGHMTWNASQRAERSRKTKAWWDANPITQEQRKKRSESAKRRLIEFPHTNPKVLGGKMTERKKAAFKKRRGVPLSPAHRDKLSAAQKRRYEYEKHHPEITARRIAKTKATFARRRRDRLRGQLSLF